MGPSRLSSAVPTDGPGPVRALRSGAGGSNARAGVAPHGGASPFARLLRGLAVEIEGGEATVRGAVTHAGNEESPRPLELLTLQADVYRYTEALDLASRLVDRVATSVKTVLQGQ
jgi:hypothetical protein